MNCKNLKQKLNKKVVCKITDKEINFKNCNYNCKYFESKYKEYKSNNRQIKKRTSKLAKLERNRFSLFSDNVNKCYLCPNTDNLTWHEIFRGSNRHNSMRYGLCLRLCLCCHELYQEDKDFNDYWHKIGQKKFMEYYNKSKEEFIKLFGRSYL